MQMEGKPKRADLKATDEVFIKAKQQGEDLYKSITPVYCPYLKDRVHFNTKGLDHLKFKKWEKSRIVYDQYTRFKLIKYIPQVISASHTVQGIWPRKEWVRVKRHGKWEKNILDVTYYEFVSVVDKIRVKIVVKEIKGGEKFFWSVIPFWGMNEVTEARKLHYKDLEYDENITEDIESNQ